MKHSNFGRSHANVKVWNRSAQSFGRSFSRSRAWVKNREGISGLKARGFKLTSSEKRFDKNGFPK
jgi:hypothetical protein